jgi:hypothetical protein
MPRMYPDVPYLGRFNVVVEVVTEGLDVRDALLAALWSEVAWEQN